MKRSAHRFQYLPTGGINNHYLVKKLLLRNAKTSIHTVFIRIEAQEFISYCLNESGVHLDPGVYFYSIHLHGQG